MLLKEPRVPRPGLRGHERAYLAAEETLCQAAYGNYFRTAGPEGQPDYAGKLRPRVPGGPGEGARFLLRPEPADGSHPTVIALPFRGEVPAGKPACPLPAIEAWVPSQASRHACLWPDHNGWCRESHRGFRLSARCHDDGKEAPGIDVLVTPEGFRYRLPASDGLGRWPVDAVTALLGVLELLEGSSGPRAFLLAWGGMALAHSGGVPV